MAGEVALGRGFVRHGAALVPADAGHTSAERADRRRVVIVQRSPAPGSGRPGRRVRHHTRTISLPSTRGRCVPSCAQPRDAGFVPGVSPAALGLVQTSQRNAERSLPRLTLDVDIHPRDLRSQDRSGARWSPRIRSSRVVGGVWDAVLNPLRNRIGSPSRFRSPGRMRRGCADSVLQDTSAARTEHRRVLVLVFRGHPLQGTAVARAAPPSPGARRGMPFQIHFEIAQGHGTSRSPGRMRRGCADPGVVTGHTSADRAERRRVWSFSSLEAHPLQGAVAAVGRRWVAHRRLFRGDRSLQRARDFVTSSSRSPLLGAPAHQNACTFAVTPAAPVPVSPSPRPPSPAVPLTIVAPLTLGASPVCAIPIDTPRARRHLCRRLLRCHPAHRSNHP